MKRGTNEYEMKSYLSLTRLSGRVHRKQTRMTRLCIMLAVALVMTLFGMADMEIRCQYIQAASQDGLWHASFKEITDEQAELIAARPEVETASWYGVFNYSLDDDYTIEGIQTCVLGFDETNLKLFPSAGIAEGEFPKEGAKKDQDAQGNEAVNGAVFTKSVKDRLGLKLGDQVELCFPWGGHMTLTASGFTGDFSMLTRQDAFGVYLNTQTFRMIAKEAGMGEDVFYNSNFFVAFTPMCNIQKTLADIRQQLGIEESQISENTKVLGLLGQSSDSYVRNIYLVAVFLALIVMVAGVLMITGSLNSNVARRTEFFGMLRCLGATRRQVMRFVRREALLWCRSAIPAGIMIGTVVIWALCLVLRILSPGWFAQMPVFGISWVGIGAGAFLGLLTVLMAARAPARRAAGVEPLAAVSGNAGTVQAVRRAANTRLAGVEVALGIHHAVSSRKNFFLLSASFAFSILLFLSFSSLIPLMDHAVNPLKPYAPDLSIVSANNGCDVPRALCARIEENASVRRVFGRSFSYDVPAILDGTEGRIDLLSYESHQFDWAKEELLSGSVEEAEAGKGVLVVYDGGNPLQVGSTILLDTAQGAKEVTVTGVLSDSPFHQTAGKWMVICSESLFYELTGQEAYTVIDIQLEKTATDADVEAIRRLAGEDFSFSDSRIKNSETRGAYYAMALFVYGFLGVILLICIFHIINSISMSVSARMRQIGMMRAIGMSVRQLAGMVAAEALAYALTGALFGSAAGLLLHKWSFEQMVSARWGDAWTLPSLPLLLILLIVLAAVFLAILAPIRRIRDMSVTDTIRE